MTKEEAIKKISGLFSADKLRGFVKESCSWDGEIDNATEVKDTFFNEFSEEIKEIASMLSNEHTKPQKVLKVGRIDEFETGDIIYVYGNNDYWPGIIRLPEDFKGYNCIECEMIVYRNGVWEEGNGSCDVYDTMVCRYATEEESQLFKSFF